MVCLIPSSGSISARLETFGSGNEAGGPLGVTGDHSAGLGKGDCCAADASE